MSTDQTGLGCPDDDGCQAGYRAVTQAYVDRHAPRLGPPPGDPPPREFADDYASWQREVANYDHAARAANGRRLALANSVYPCPNCQPELFLRWQEGDWPYRKREAKAAPVTAPTANDMEHEQRADLFA